MTKKIWKVKIPDQTCCEREFPVGARIVYAHIQQGEFTFWYEFNTQETKTKLRKFSVFGTGDEIPGSAEYVTTVFDAHWIWHLYEVF